MKYFKIFVISFILVNVWHKAVPQEEMPGDATTAAPAAPAASEAPANPAEPATPAAPAAPATPATSAAPAANDASTSGMTAAPPSETQATTTAAAVTAAVTEAATTAATTSAPAGAIEAATTPAPPQTGLDSIAGYLNRKIGQELLLNPSKTEGSLARSFNEERSKLENARIVGTATDDAISRAEQALKDFETFVLRYKPIEYMLNNALDDLETITGNMRLPLEYRYMALMLQSKLAGSSNLNDAERTLKQYAEFKKGQTPTDNNVIPPSVTPSPGMTPPSGPSSFPPLNDEYRKYFEEILQILRKNLQVGSPQMTYILQQILNDPKQVKKVLDNLKEVAEDFICDFLEDIFDFF